MTNQEFNQIVEERFSKTKQVLLVKGQEYCPIDDRLHNFKRSADALDKTPAQTCFYFMQKHLTSIYDIVNSTTAADPSLIDEKIGDAINYLILLEAILKENNGK